MSDIPDQNRHQNPVEQHYGLKENTSNPTRPSFRMPLLSAFEEDVLELGDDFDFEGFQVVRREFFAHLREPSATFNKCKFNVNAASLARFPHTDYVQVLVNRDTKILALRPCEEGMRDSFLWCGVSRGKRKPKHITCKLFFAKIVSMMDWDPTYRYKILGRLIHANGEYLLAFDLSAAEVYQCKVADDGKIQTSKTPVFPASWQDQFGLPFNEHKQSMQINIFDGYAVYAIKEKGPSSNEEHDSHNMGKQSLTTDASQEGDSLV